MSAVVGDADIVMAAVALRDISELALAVFCLGQSNKG